MLHGCETSSLTLREELWPRVTENRILKQIFRSERNENGHWRRLYNEEFHNLYCSHNIIRAIKCRKLKWTKNVARKEEGKNAFKTLIGKPTAKRS